MSDNDNAERAMEETTEAGGGATAADETEGDANQGDANNNNNNNNTGNRAQLAELPLEWTQMGQCNDPDAPGNVIRLPSEVGEINKEETEIMIVGTAGQKITKIGEKFYEQVSPHLQKLILRSHLIRTMEGLDGMKELQLLELYDNMVDELRNLNDGENGTPGTSLTVLDMSYNVIRDMKPVEFCPNLTELCKYLYTQKFDGIVG